MPDSVLNLNGQNKLIVHLLNVHTNEPKGHFDKATCQAILFQLLE